MPRELLDLFNALEIANRGNVPVSRHIMRHIRRKLWLRSFNDPECGDRVICRKDLEILLVERLAYVKHLDNSESDKQLGVSSK